VELATGERWAVVADSHRVAAVYAYATPLPPMVAEYGHGYRVVPSSSSLDVFAHLLHAPSGRHRVPLDALRRCVPTHARHERRRGARAIYVPGGGLVDVALLRAVHAFDGPTVAAAWMRSSPDSTGHVLHLAGTMRGGLSALVIAAECWPSDADERIPILADIAAEVRD
jgi:hypothetical protein